MRKKIATFTFTALMSLGILHAQTMEPFKPKLQTGSELSIDKLREQNLHVVKKAVEGIGEHLPQKVDEYTQIVAIESNGTKLIYTFEVQSGPQSDETMKQKGQKMAPRIKEGICFSSKRFLQADITLRYRYLSSATQKEILRVDVDKEQCQKIWNQPEN
jgi:hypothetical protein